MANTPIDIEYLVNEIENIIDQYYPSTLMYYDILPNINKDEDICTDIEIEKMNISIKTYKEEWIKLLQEYQMDYDDFICNVLMAVLSEICSDVSIKGNDPYDIVSRRKVDLRQKKIIATKEKNYGKSLYEQQPYYQKIKQKNLSKLFHMELTLLFHGYISEREYSNKSINPLLKLTCSNGIDLAHFSKKDLKDIVEYYKCICNYITDDCNEIKLFDRMIIIYHLEMETRFSTIFKILNRISSGNLNDIQKNILYQIRDICNANKVNNIFDGTVCRYQNLLYFGKEYYIENLGQYCNIGDYDSLEKTRWLLRTMYKIVKLIYVIRDTIMDRLKKNHLENYNDFINNTYESLKTKFGMNQGLLYKYEKQLLKENQKLIIEYESFHNNKIKVDHFIRMYVSDDKFDNLQILEYNKKKSKHTYK